MADLIYTTKPTSLAKFLDHIQTAGVPPKVNGAYLKSVGFRDSNDTSVIRVLKSVGFVDAAGTPTPSWRAYRDRSKGRAVLGEAVKRAYRDLFETYPDADRKDTEALRNFFSAHSTAGNEALALAVRTFKALAGGADFEGPTESPESEPVVAVQESPLPTLQVGSHAVRPTIAVNVELHLPATDDPKVWESLFAAMRKHLLDES